MDLLDGTMTTVASAGIARDLQASSTQLQWILGAYGLTFAAGLVAGARLGDILGRKQLFLVGVTCYVLSAVGCAAAPDSGVLIGFRLLQGLGAALLIPQGLGLIRAVFAGEQLGRALSLIGPVVGLASVFGPVLGGLIIDADLYGWGWRPVFLIHVLLGVIAAVGAQRQFPQSRLRPAPRLDLGGCLLLGLFSGLLIYPLIQGRDSDWAPWTFGMIAASGLALAGFVVWTRRRLRTGRDPLVVPSVFDHRAFTAGIVTMFALFSGMIGGIFTLTVFLRFGQQVSAVRAGLTLTPFAAGLAAGAVLASMVVVPRLGRTTLQLGALLMGAGSLATWRVVDGSGLDTSAAALIGPQLTLGVGIGLILAPLIDFVVGSVRDFEVGSATGVFNFVQQLAGAAGVATIGTLFFSVLDDAGFAAAYTRCLLVEAALAATLFVVTFLLPRRPPAALNA